MKLAGILVILAVIYLVVNMGSQCGCGKGYMAQYPHSVSNTSFLPMTRGGNYGQDFNFKTNSNNKIPYNWSQDAMSGNKY
tara:strand:- start:210 stop:449 length:240 start_codon:yes stop_codon:yes gene_type:complete